MGDRGSADTGPEVGRLAVGPQLPHAEQQRQHDEESRQQALQERERTLGEWRHDLQYDHCSRDQEDHAVRRRPEGQRSWSVR